MERIFLFFPFIKLNTKVYKDGHTLGLGIYFT